jgi:hypothetical protein
MSKLLATCTLLAACILPGVASGECVGRTYHVSGKVVDTKGRPLFTTITFSWAEEHDGRHRQTTGKTLNGQYTVEIPFYTQAKSVPGVAPPGGGIYACNASLKTLHYAYASAPGKQESGALVLTGDHTTANLPLRMAAKPIDQ